MCAYRSDLCTHHATKTYWFHLKADRILDEDERLKPRSCCCGCLSGLLVSQKTACINDYWSIYDIIIYIYNIQSNRIYKHQHSVAFIILYRPLRPLCVSEQLQDWAACWHSSLFLTEVGWRNHAVKHSDQVIVEAALIGKHLQKNMLMRLCYVILMRYISLHPPKLM